MGHQSVVWRLKKVNSNRGSQINMDVKEAVLSFIDSNNRVPGNTEEERLSCSYLDTGIIDSMGIVLMITEFEERFGILFDAEELQSHEFQTIGGLIGIIERKLAVKT